jgi:hypothetical protein
MLITDTNIWYDLADGKIDIESLSERPVVLTAASLFEIITSCKIINNQRYIKNINKLIKIITPIYYDEMPLEFILNRDYNIKVNTPLQIESIIKTVSNLEDTNYLKQLVDTRKSLNYEFKKSVDNQKKSIRKNIKLFNYDDSYNIQKPVYMKQAIKKLNCFLNSTLSVSKIKLSYEDVSSNSKLFPFLSLHAAYSYYLNYENNGGNSAGKNDQIDLLNFMYVNVNDNYLSSDNIYKKIRNVDNSLSHYFEPIEIIGEKIFRRKQKSKYDLE